MNIEIYKDFESLLFVRLKNQIFTTEDSVRYTFFSSLISKGRLKPHEIILEQPHNSIAGAKIDTYIAKHNSRPVAIEFKYHREIPSQHNQHRTDNAGQVFGDIRRLLDFHIKGAIRLLIYLTDREMANYMLNHKNGLYDFFSLDINNRLKIDNKFWLYKSKAFIAKAGNPFNATISSEWTASLPENHELRIYKIL